MSPARFVGLSVVALKVLPGRLFTTRMPRNVKTDPASADAFKARVQRYKLNTVLILTETEEYQKYAGGRGRGKERGYKQQWHVICMCDHQKPAVQRLWLCAALGLCRACGI